MHAQQMTYTRLSQDLLYAIRTEDVYTAISDSLAAVTENALAAELKTDAQKLAFWLNIYNAHVQLLLRKDPKLWAKRSAFYSAKEIRIAGHALSLDEVEHGILRRSKAKLALGYMNTLFPGKFERRFRVDKTDARIHFALNCGASSCPPIAFYKPEAINEQLDQACASYLLQECKLEKGTVTVPKLFSWFRGDFGGKKGIRRFLEKYAVIPKGSKPGIAFKPYNWSLELGKYTN